MDRLSVPSVSRRLARFANAVSNGFRSRAVPVGVVAGSLLVGASSTFASGSAWTLPSAPTGLDATSITTEITTALTPYWTAILGISVITFGIGTFIMVFKRKTTGAVRR
jgi:hypothetical protein